MENSQQCLNGLSHPRRPQTALTPGPMTVMPNAIVISGPMRNPQMVARQGRLFDDCRRLRRLSKPPEDFRAGHRQVLSTSAAVLSSSAPMLAVCRNVEASTTTSAWSVGAKQEGTARWAPNRVCTVEAAGKVDDSHRCPDILRIVLRAGQKNRRSRYYRYNCSIVRLQFQGITCIALAYFALR
jgi:hypothetical protein